MRTTSLLTLAALSGVAFFAACGTKNPGDSQNVLVNPDNHAPTANAGNDQTQPADATITLSGAASVDADGDVLTYVWSFDHVPEGSTITEREAPFTANHSTAAVTTTFQPDKVGTYVIALVVTDTSGASSAADYVIITAAEPENIPVANAGADQSVAVGSSASLSGTGSYDPVGRALTYSWTLVDKPTNSAVTAVSDPTSATPTLSIDAKGAYVVSLVVDNGLAPSNADEITITGTADDSAPTANAGPDQTNAQDCTTITLDCSGSSDPDGDALTYSWTLQAKPSNSTATLTDTTSVNPTFYPDQAGSYVFSCAVNDGTNWSTPDTMNVVAAERATNTRPVVSAGADQGIDAGSASCAPSGYVYDCEECSDKTASLGADASISDPDGDPISIEWTVVSGDATISDPTAMSTQVLLQSIAPTEPGLCEDVVYEFKLSVTDCTGAVSTDTVRFTASCCGTEDTSTR